MKSFAAVLAVYCVGPSAAFVPAPKASPVASHNNAPCRGATSALEAQSKALPFMEAPEKLDGSMIGDFGFDPLKLTENIDLPYARAAELKHGRVSMLAIVGFLLTQYVHLPGDQFAAGPLEALTTVPAGAQAQVFTFIGVFEMSSILQAYSAKTDDPWEILIQDPKGAKGFYAKSAAEQERLKLSEVKHSRLAMLAIMGEVVQMMMFHKPSIEF